jgi:hypothetical protein
VIDARLVYGFLALVIALLVWRWHRKGRAEWNDYDDKHHGDDNPLVAKPGAASRARGADRDRD